jgi:hypothetical protein
MSILDKKNRLIKILSELNYTYDEPKNDILDKLYDLYKNNIIDEECTDGDYITYKAYYFYAILKNSKLAKKYFKDAVEKENTHGMHGLAMLYKDSENTNKMIKYLKMAIEKNDMVAVIDYGNHLLFEENNLRKAMKYYNIAKKNNYFRIYYELAYYYYEFKFNYYKCKENMILFLQTFTKDNEVYLNFNKLRDTVFQKLVTLILVHEYEDDINFLKPLADILNINIDVTINQYKFKIDSRKQFKINKEKFTINGECGICYDEKKLYLFDCIGHHICNDCYKRIDKCPFCCIMKHPLMIKNKNIKEDISYEEIDDDNLSDISDYETTNEGESISETNSDRSGYEPNENELENEDEDNEDEENEDEEDEGEYINLNQLELIDLEEQHLDGGNIYTPPNELEE